MKKFILSFLIIITAVCASVAITSCAPEQEHDWGEWSAVEEQAPTCTENGLESRICLNCGERQERPVEKLGHDWAYYVHNEGDALDTGDGDTHTRACKRKNCNAMETDCCEFILDVVDPTCQRGGYTVLTCTYCGYSDTRDVTEPVPHKYTGEWEYSGDLLSGWDGTPRRAHSRRCDYGCGIVIAEPCEHDSVTIPADCENGGYTEYTCKICGHSYTETTEKLNHIWGEWRHSEEVENTHYRTCLRNGCDETETDKCEYNSVTISADCENGGYTVYTCKVCGHSYTETTEKLNHIWGEWRHSEEVENTHYRTCLRNGCDQTYSEQCKYIDFVTEATCLEEGYTTHTCYVCKFMYIDSYTEIVDHKWSKVVYSNDTLYNHKHREMCNMCKMIREYAPVVLVSITRSDPTCLDVGRVYTYCTGCDKAISKPIPALGHDWGDWKYSGQRNGIDYHYHRCTRCSRYESAKCSMVEVEQVTTCVAPGTVTETCELCFHAKTQNGADVVLGHDWGDWAPVEGGHIRYCMREGCEATDTKECSFSYVTTDPTCEEEGSVVYTCSTCGYTYTEFISAKGHIFKGEWKCGDDGTHYRECHTDPSHIETEPCTFKTEDAGDCVIFTCTVCGYTYTVNSAVEAEYVCRLVIFKKFRLA